MISIQGATVMLSNRFLIDSTSQKQIYFSQSANIYGLVRAVQLRKIRRLKIFLRFGRIGIFEPFKRLRTCGDLVSFDKHLGLNYLGDFGCL